MVNRGDGVVLAGNKTCRTTKNVVAIRAVFVDLDGAPLGPVETAPVPPDITIESSPKRYHAFWIAPGCTLDEFAQRQKQLAIKFGSDPSVHDLPRVMRLPGFFHQKGDPFLTQILKVPK